MHPLLTGQKKITAEKFYADVIRTVAKSRIPFLLGGTYAVREYTGIDRPTKDVDFFCKAGDVHKILKFMQDHGYISAVKDERYVAKVTKGAYYVDFIFGSANAVSPVTESWFANAPVIKLLGTRVPITPPEDLIWSKVFVQDRYKYDGSDIAHLILKQHTRIDWKRLLTRLDPYWEVLLIHILNFRFIYPSEREIIPLWLFDELLERLSAQKESPISQIKLCRGRLFSRVDYGIDVKDWGFADVIGEGSNQNGRKKWRQKPHKK